MQEWEESGGLKYSQQLTVDHSGISNCLTAPEFGHSNLFSLSFIYLMFLIAYSIYTVCHIKMATFLCF